MANSKIQKGVVFERLWRNSNDTQAFTEQTITFLNPPTEIRYYKMFVVNFKVRTSINKVISSVFYVGTPYPIEVYCLFDVSLRCARHYQLLDNNRLFISGESQSDGSGFGNDNTFLIPIEVYGIR